MQVLLYLLIATGYVLFVAVAILLVRTYHRTHDIGFVWLGAAVLVWPVLARLLGVVIDRGGAGPFPITGPLVAVARTSQQVFSLVLLLVAVLYLGRTKQANTPAV